MNNKDTMHLRVKSFPKNESFTRAVVGSFATRLNPTVEQLMDLKTAISEAVTNSIVHGYKNKIGYIDIFAEISQKTVMVTIMDAGVGMKDVEKMMQPFITTCSDDERSGMGFTVMETFMDSLKVKSKVNEGTTVIMTKILDNNSQEIDL